MHDYTLGKDRGAMQDKVWITRDGRAYLVSEMETRHIVNCINMILRRKGWRRRYLERLYLELVIRDIQSEDNWDND
jgi:hypothetical protein